VRGSEIKEILFGQPGEDGLAQGIAITTQRQQTLSGVFSDVASGDKRGYNPRKIHWCAGRSVQFLRACGQAHGLSPAPGLSLS
jgi:hypothetical protein